ncbi:hypothetical protein IU427_02040 [Nocardia beijingensis]|uniref:hypothetical protein n=1 Tax=Nocardia beijingensis TaxID=95162 RepID=UPI0018958FCB|nr:hypothetical protein [Nocardia beijingensis]MBF6463956.1 hypothetical protein [Nocardia beijingensis]
MEHGQQTGESIGAMLSSIASALREVSEKLDTVAARIDGAQAVVSEPTVEGRLAKLEAWAFGAGQDISGLDARVERLESGAGPAPEDREATQRPAAPLPRAAARRSSARRPEHSAEPTAPKSESPDSAGTRNGTPREPVHAVPEPSPAAPTSFTPPREPTLTALDSNTGSAQGFTASGNPASDFTPPPREPTFTTPAPREPLSSFTAPTPRDPGTGQRETFTSREPAPAAGSYSPAENAPYESIVASAATTKHSGSENGAVADATGTGLTGAHRAGVDDRTPVENTHVDKLQAMLDELKRTAAAPLGRTDVFGPTPGESTTNGYQSERTEAQRRPADYRLSSPPPVS